MIILITALATVFVLTIIAGIEDYSQQKNSGVRVNKVGDRQPTYVRIFQVASLVFSVLVTYLIVIYSRNS